MRLISIIIFSILCSITCHAQSFKKLIDINKDDIDDNTKSSVVYDNHLFFISYSADTISQSFNFVIVKSDLQGNILDQNEIESSINTGFNSLIVIDTFLYFSDAPKIAFDTSSYNLFQIDPNNLGVINKKSFKIGPPSDGIVQDGITTYKDYILLYGSNLESPKSEGIILFVDIQSLELDTIIRFTNGNLQYGSVIDCQQVNENLRVLRSNGYHDGFIVEDFNENFESINSFEMTVATHGVDNGGWGTILNPKNSIELRNNGNIIIGTNRASLYSFYHYDYNGRLLHRFEKEYEIYGGYGLLRYLENNDGGITLFGQATIGIYQGEPIHVDDFLSVPSDERKLITAPFILKLNENYEIVFDHIYAQLDPSELNDFNFFRTVHELDDGSFIGLGSGNSLQYQERPFSNAWDKTGEVLIMRVSEDGCFDEEECILTSNNWQVLTNTSEVLEDGQFVNVYPNPAQDFITIAYSGSQKLEYNIYNILGKRQVVSSAARTIDVSTLNMGIYILQIEDKNSSEVTAVKFVIAR